MKNRLFLTLFLCLFGLLKVSGLGLGVYADAGYLGVNQHNEPGSSNYMSAGLELGLLTPYLLDGIITIGVGSINDRAAFLTSYIAHYTYMLSNKIGIYVGAGLGVDAIFGSRFSDQRDPREADLHGVLVSGIFPLGVKFFPKVSIEVYAEARFNVGSYYTWKKNYTTDIPDPRLLSDKIAAETFYWGVGGRLGMRYWF